MRLPAPFIKLPLRFDTARLKAEIGQFPENEWRAHPQGFAGNSALILVSHDGGENDDTTGAMGPAPRLARCPYLQQVMASFQAVIGRSRLMRLEPGAEVTPHTDIDFYWRDRIRIHIPILTDPSVRFNCDSVEIHMAEGEAWIFDNWRPHHVINGSGIRRVHLVMDTVGSAAFWRMASGGLMSAGSGTEPVQALDFNSTLQPSLAFEGSHPEPLSHPAVVKATVQELLTDLRNAPGRTSQQTKLESTLLDFSNAWQALWARFGTTPAGRAHFAVLIDDALKQAGRYSRGMRLPSNGALLSMVLQKFLPPMFEGAETWLSTAPRPHFRRPIIILAPPRSGSTLFFETLQHHPDLWSLGDESHVEIESIPGLSLQDHGLASNALKADDLTDTVKNHLLGNFALQLRDHHGRRWITAGEDRPDSPRLLEKTPKNALRIPFFDALFPDALFLYLHRDAAGNLGSMMDAWQSGRFVTYGDLPGWDGPPWSLLLTPGWQASSGRSLAEVVVQQWRAANEAILTGLASLPRDRWRALDYADLVSDPSGTFERAVSFLKLSPAGDISRSLAGGLPLSRYTINAPTKDKWRRHEAALGPLLPALQPLERRIQALDNSL